MKQQVSKLHSALSPRQVGPILVTAADVERYADLAALGINIGGRELQQMIDNLMPTLDSIDAGPLATLSTASITTPVQFLQSWLPGFVRFLSQARKIDKLIGINTVGAWDDEEVVQMTMEPVGTAVLYSDTGNVPLASYQNAFERRTVIRFEKGISVSVLEEARAARMRVATAAEKRTSASLALEISRNRVGFSGFSSGSNRTYGLLNDPALPAYATVAATGTGATTTWSTKDFIAITGDIRTAMAAIQTGSGDTIDPEEMETCLTVSTNTRQYLNVTSVTGGFSTMSVKEWINKTYPKCRIESAPELNSANGGANVFYLWAETVEDSSTDDMRTFAQIVPAKFMTLGVEKRSKQYIEDYSNATAGTMCKRPYAVYRGTGI